MDSFIDAGEKYLLSGRRRNSDSELIVACHFRKRGGMSK